MFWFLKYFLYLAGGSVTLTTGFASYLAFLQPSFYFPQPTGKYAVGTATYHFVDEKRKAVAQDAASGKELMVQIWYPSSDDKSMQKPIAPYAPYFINYYKKNQKLAWLLAMSRPMFTHAAQDAPLINSAGKLPMIIFSHCLGSTRNSNTAHCEELASHGYIVISSSHSCGCGLIDFPENRLIAFDPMKNLETMLRDPMESFRSMNNDIEIWVDDVQIVLDNLKKISADHTSPFYHKLDMNNIGMFGHSYGGAATAQLCRRDQRIKAGINMDGALLGTNAIEPFDKPFMFLLAEKLSKEEMHKLVLQAGLKKDAEEYTDAMYESYLPSIDKLIKSIGHDAYKIVLKNSKHMAFCDVALMKETNPIARFLVNKSAGSLDGFQAIEIVNAYLVAFFDKYLKGTSSILLDGDKSIYPEVIFEK